MEPQSYSKYQVLLGALLGGPFGTIFFLHRNFLAMSADDKARKTKIIGLILTAIMIAAMPVIPEVSYERLYLYFMVPGSILSFIICAREQGALNGSARYSYWNVFWWSAFGCMALFQIALFVVIMLYEYLGVIPPDLLLPTPY